jgi:hypothetical protein
MSDTPMYNLVQNTLTFYSYVKAGLHQPGFFGRKHFLERTLWVFQTARSAGYWVYSNGTH